MNSEELNQTLFQKCISDTVDYTCIEKLLQSGAKPLGKIFCDNSMDNLYTAVVENYIDDEVESEAFFKITELFIKYGMRINAPEIPYDDDGISHPLWFFGFHLNQIAFRVLKLLLDNGLDADSAGKAWGHEFLDYFDVYGELEDKVCYELFYDALKKLLFIASYPHVLDNDEDLKKLIWLSQNVYDPLNFRDINNFTFDVDTSKCLHARPEVYRSIVTVKEKASGKAVWKMGLGLSPEEV